MYQVRIYYHILNTRFDYKHFAEEHGDTVYDITNHNPKAEVLAFLNPESIKIDESDKAFVDVEKVLTDRSQKATYDLLMARAMAEAKDIQQYELKLNHLIDNDFLLITRKDLIDIYFEEPSEDPMIKRARMLEEFESKELED